MDRKITQGTIITAIRSAKYSGVDCYGIVITARCDLSNDKVQKVFYLEAIQLDNWALSCSGFKEIINGLIKSWASELQDAMKNNDLDWETIKTFSEDEFNRVVDSEISGNVSKIKQKFHRYKNCCRPDISLKERKEILMENSKTVLEKITQISNGQNSHFVYIPEEAIEKVIHNGIIVDLQELDYINLEQVNDLLSYSIDIKNEKLSEAKKEEYNKKFVLYDPPGYSMILCDIKSPWVEYLMQHFSNAFARIGVDNPPKGLIEEMLKKVYEEG